MDAVAFLAEGAGPAPEREAPLSSRTHAQRHTQAGGDRAGARRAPHGAGAGAGGGARGACAGAAEAPGPMEAGAAQRRQLAARSSQLV